MGACQLKDALLFVEHFLECILEKTHVIFAPYLHNYTADSLLIKTYRKCLRKKYGSSLYLWTCLTSLSQRAEAEAKRHHSVPHFFGVVRSSLAHARWSFVPWNKVMAVCKICSICLCIVELLRDIFLCEWVIVSRGSSKGSKSWKSRYVIYKRKAKKEKREVEKKKNKDLFERTLATKSYTYSLICAWCMKIKEKNFSLRRVF